MAVIYGWTYAEFHANVGWDKGAEAVYNYWENYWAAQIDAYIFNTPGTHLTDSDEMAEVQTIVNKMMILTNIYLKGESNETPLMSGFYSSPGFPMFSGDPDDNNGKGSGDYIILNKFKRKYGEEFVRADSLRFGVDPDQAYFQHDRMLR